MWISSLLFMICFFFVLRLSFIKYLIFMELISLISILIFLVMFHNSSFFVLLTILICDAVLSVAVLFKMMKFNEIV